MKINGFTILSILSLVASSVARWRAKPTYEDDNDPINQKSRVTAFLNTDEGLQVQCWEIGDLLPQSKITREDGSKGSFSQKRLLGNIDITLFSFAPSVTIFSFGTSEVHSNAVDFRAKPNLFTVKDGLIFIEALPINDDNNFGAHTTFGYDLQEQCSKSQANADDSTQFDIRTISGSDTTLINFQYDSTPTHRVLHAGRCNFAGLRPVSDSSEKDSIFRAQEM